MNPRDFLPPANAFSHHFSVAPEAIDELGHAGNVTWVRWVQDAATEHSFSVGLGLDQYRELGLLWVVRRHEVDYLQAAFEGDAIVAATWIEGVKGATAIRRTRFVREKDGVELARARTTWVLLNIATGRPTRVPPMLQDRYGFVPTERSPLS